MSGNDADIHKAIRTGKISFLVLAAVIVATAAFGQAPPAAAPPAAARAARVSPIVSPEVRADGRVTFRIRAETASTVSVTGLGDPIPMSKDATGVWSATTGEPLVPDIYMYGFDVDGAKVPDPANLTESWAGSSSGQAATTSTLLIPGQPWSNREAVHGQVARANYQSAIIGGPETYYVYTPPEYNPRRKKPYPVLVVLGGLGQYAQDWIIGGGANLTLDTLISEGKAEPMILVSPTPFGNTGGTRAAAAGFPNFTRALIEEILPRVEKQYNASMASKDHAITGLSAGAAQSLLLLNRLDQFQWIGSFSPGFDMYNPGWGTPAVAPTVNGQRSLLPPGNLDNVFSKLSTADNRRIKLLYLACGTADDHLNLTRQFKSFLDAKNIRVTYVEGEGYQHAWPFWRRQLAAFAELLFKPASG